MHLPLPYWLPILPGTEACCLNWWLSDTCWNIQVVKTMRTIVSFALWVTLMCQTITPSDIYHQTYECYKVTVYSHALKNRTYSSKEVYLFSSKCAKIWQKIHGARFEVRRRGERGKWWGAHREGRKKWTDWEVREKEKGDHKFITGSTEMSWWE